MPARTRRKLLRHGIAAAVGTALALGICGVNAATEKPSSTMTAAAVMAGVDKRYEGDTRRQQGTMTLVDKDNSKRVRRFSELAKKYGDDEKAISHVTFPPEVSGTGFLSYEWDDRKREDESWLYLPQLRKVKRLASTDKSGYFLGSDFTYSDLVGLEVEDFDYSFADDAGRPGEEGLSVIMAVPKQALLDRVADETGYVKVKYWVDKEKLIIVKAQYWLKEGHRIKYYTASNIEKVSDIWTVRRMQMVMTQGGQRLHASVFELAKIEYNVPIDDQEFTTYALERPVE